VYRITGVPNVPNSDCSLVKSTFYDRSARSNYGVLPYDD
jgi:hypothetical protein